MQSALSPVRASKTETDPQVLSSARPGTLILRPFDVVTLCAPFFFALIILSGPSHVPNWPTHVAAFMAAILGGALCRLWGQRRPEYFPARFIGSFYMVPVIHTVWSRLGPVIDRVTSVTYDHQMQAIDQWAFGLQPSIWLQKFYHPWLTEILFLAYTAFFIWQFALALILAHNKSPYFQDYMLAVILFYMISFIFYILIPVVGPRFALQEIFTVPLEGLWLTPIIERSFLTTPTIRDCFPSGHTGLTLMVLYYAHKTGCRRFFKLMLPFALLLVISTIYCRFHYAIDLICALPFTLGIVLLSQWIARTFPRTVALEYHRLIPARSSAK